MRQMDAQVAACEAQLRAEVQAAWAELALGPGEAAQGEAAAPPSLRLRSSARGVGLPRLLRALHKLGALEPCVEQAPSHSCARLWSQQQQQRQQQRQQQQQQQQQ